MIGQTNSLVGGHGGALVFAEPLQSQILHKDDKVFIEKVDFVSEQAYTAAVSGAAINNAYVAPFFINEAIAACPAPNYDISLRYLKYSTGWLALSGCFQVNALGYAMFRSLTRGDFLVVGGNHLLLVDETQASDISHNSIYYAAKFGDYDYAVSSLDGSIYLYDWGVKSASEVILSRSLNYAMHGADENAQLLFIQDTDMVFHLFNFANNTFSEAGYATLGGLVVAYTGLDDGDYLFAVEKHGATYNKHYLSTIDTNYVAGSGTCNLKIYVSDGEGGVAAIGASSPLYRFTTEPAIAHFDSRTSILFIGTTSEVHFFYWDHTDKTFTEILIDDLTLPTNPDGNHIYNAAISPQFRNLLIYCGTAGDGGRNVKIYDLSAIDKWKVVALDEVALHPELVWSALATGNTDATGRAEVQTALPAEINVTVEITPTPDHFNFSGDE